MAAFVTLTGKPGGSTSNTFYGIVSGGGTTIQDGDDYYRTYTVENDQDSVTVKIDAATRYKLSTGSLVSFAIASDGVYDQSNTGGRQPDITVYTGTTYDDTHGLATWVKEYSAKDQTITYWNRLTGDQNTGYAGAKKVLAPTDDDGTSLALDDKVQIVYVDSDKEEAGSNTGVTQFNGVNGYKNVLLVKENGVGNNKVVAIFVETSGEANIIGDDVTPKALAAISNNGTQINTTELADVDDGVYTPAVVAGDAFNDAGTPADVRVFKYSTKKAGDYTLKIYNAAGTKVFEETFAGVTDTTTAALHYFYINVAVGNDMGANATYSGGWSKGAALAAGTYTFTIENATNTDVGVVLQGYFNV